MFKPMHSIRSKPVKENSGGNFRRRMLIRVMIWILLLFLLYSLLVRYYLAGFVPDVEVNKRTGKKIVRKRPERDKKIVNGKEVFNTPLDGIMEGHWQLVDIQIPETGLQRKITGKDDGDDFEYANVEAVFCVLNWKRQKDNPANVPMFHDLTDQSVLCPTTTHTFDLYDVAKKARIHDVRHNSTIRAKPSSYALKNTTYTHVDKQRPVSPTAVIFHETRCGSTLLGNMLSSFSPSQSRVYSEARAPSKAVMACEGHNNNQQFHCSKSLQDQLIKDVFYLMGRTNHPGDPQYVFYKMHSTSIYGIDAFVRAMPQTPWVFLFRDSVEILVGHLLGTRKDHPPEDNHDGSVGIGQTPLCLQNYRKPGKHSAMLVEIVESKDRTVNSLSKEEYCAAHLASLCEAAIFHYKHTEERKHVQNNGIFVNYNQLPQVAWETLLPHFGVPMIGARVQKMEETAGSHSHGKGYQHIQQDWIEDAEEKQKQATTRIRNAAEEFLQGPYQQLQGIVKKQNKS